MIKNGYQKLAFSKAWLPDFSQCSISPVITCQQKVLLVHGTHGEIPRSCPAYLEQHAMIYSTKVHLMGFLKIGDMPIDPNHQHQPATVMVKIQPTWTLVVERECPCFIALGPKDHPFRPVSRTVRVPHRFHRWSRSRTAPRAVPSEPLRRTTLRIKPHKDP